MEPQLKDAIALLEAWSRVQLFDDAVYSTQILLENTKKFLESVENERG